MMDQNCKIWALPIPVGNQMWLFDLKPDQTTEKHEVGQLSCPGREQWVCPAVLRVGGPSRSAACWRSISQPVPQDQLENALGMLVMQRLSKDRESKSQ